MLVLVLVAAAAARGPTGRRLGPDARGAAEPLASREQVKRATRRLGQGAAGLGAGRVAESLASLRRVLPGKFRDDLDCR